MLCMGIRSWSPSLYDCYVFKREGIYLIKLIILPHCWMCLSFLDDFLVELLRSLMYGVMLSRNRDRRLISLVASHWYPSLVLMLRLMLQAQYWKGVTVASSMSFLNSVWLIQVLLHSFRMLLAVGSSYVNLIMFRCAPSNSTFSSSV